MALKATICRAELEISDIDRDYYATHHLTLARHPSETDERMMVRLLAFAMHAHDTLEFGRGLSTDDEPDLWQKNASGEIECWIEVGLPDERRLRRAAGRAQRLVLLAYGQNGLEVWWRRNSAALARLSALTVWALPDIVGGQLADMAARAMKLQCTIQDGHIALSDASSYVPIELIPLQAAA